MTTLVPAPGKHLTITWKDSLRAGMSPMLDMCVADNLDNCIIPLFSSIALLSIVQDAGHLFIVCLWCVCVARNFISASKVVGGRKSCRQKISGRNLE